MRDGTSILVFATQHMATGGIESHLQQFCYHINKAGVGIDLVILNSEMLPETIDFFEKVCRKLYFCSYKSSYLRNFWLCLLGIKLSAAPYHAVYTNGQGESVYFFRQLLLRTKKWIHHHHSSGDYYDQLTWGRAYRRALLLANSVIACSKTNARDIEISLHRTIHSIPCFSRQLKVLKKINHEKLRFGYFGRLIPEKGIETLCALSKDPDLNKIEFHLWGEGASYSKLYFEQSSNVKYHGSFRGDEELSEVVSFLDCYLLFSTHSEGLPIALLEAMSVGLPWLATNRGGISDIALDPLSTRVIPSSSKYHEIKSAVLSFASDLNSGNVSKKSQISLYKNKFSSSLLVKQWLEIFEFKFD